MKLSEQSFFQITVTRLTRITGDILTAFLNQNLIRLASVKSNAYSYFQMFLQKGLSDLRRVSLSSARRRVH